MLLFKSINFLPELNEKLKKLICRSNLLTSLPQLNIELQELMCSNNNITSFPEINEKLNCLNYDENPLPDIFMRTPEYDEDPYYYNFNNAVAMRKKVKVYNRFRFMFYAIKFKKQFNKWLWKSREKKIKAQFSPEKLHELLEQNKGENLENILEKW